MKRVYVAGAYSAGNTIDCLKNIGKGEYYAGRIFTMGYAPFCPWHDKSYVMTNWDIDFTVKMFYDYSIAWLNVSEVMFLIPGWEHSESTLAEIEIAEQLGIPIVESFPQLEKY